MPGPQRREITGVLGRVPRSITFARPVQLSHATSAVKDWLASGPLPSDNSSDVGASIRAGARHRTLDPGQSDGPGPGLEPVPAHRLGHRSRHAGAGHRRRARANGRAGVGRAASRPVGGRAGGGGFHSSSGVTSSASIPPRSRPGSTGHAGPPAARRDASINGDCRRTVGAGGTCHRHPSRSLR